MKDSGMSHNTDALLFLEDKDAKLVLPNLPRPACERKRSEFPIAQSSSRLSHLDRPSDAL